MKISNSLTAVMAASSFAQAMPSSVHDVRDVSGPVSGGDHPPPPHLADGRSGPLHLDDDDHRDDINRNGDGDTTPEHLEDDNHREGNVDRNGDSNSLPDHLEDTNTANTDSQAVPQQGDLENIPYAGVAAVDNNRYGGGNKGGDGPDEDRNGDGNGPDGYRNVAGVNTRPMLGGIAGVAVAVIMAL